METEAPKMKTTDLADAFTAAEDAVKLAERVSGDVALPAINQLRYALCHLLEGNEEFGHAALHSFSL